MKQIYISDTSGKISTIESYEIGCWVDLVNPTDEECSSVADRFGIDAQDLRAPLDLEESSRISAESDCVMILVDIPTTEIRNDNEGFITIPLGIFLCNDSVVTVCMEGSSILADFAEGRVKGYFSFMKSRFTLQVLYRISRDYLARLAKIDRMSDEIEQRLYGSTRNEELIKLLELQKSLVYFSTSLKQNERVLEKLVNMKEIRKYPEDEELLEDTIIENRQALEMAGIYGNITSGVMDAYASIVANNQNSIMKILALVTIIMSIPTMIFSAYGMNVAAEGMPFSDQWWAFGAIIIGSFIISLFATLFFIIRKWF